MVDERTIQVALTARELRWFLEQIGCTVDPDAIRGAVRDGVQVQLERSLFELEERE